MFSPRGVWYAVGAALKLQDDPQLPLRAVWCAPPGDCFLARAFSPSGYNGKPLPGAAIAPVRWTCLAMQQRAKDWEPEPGPRLSHLFKDKEAERLRGLEIAEVGLEPRKTQNTRK
jgi:hypothetical protein